MIYYHILIKETKSPKSTILSASKDAKQLKLSYVADGNIKWYSHFKNSSTENKQPSQKMGERSK